MKKRIVRKKELSIKERYTIEAKPYEVKKGCWKCNKVSIYQNFEDGTKKKIGSYERNYHNMFDTWLPFEQNGKHYALYSDDYMWTSVMSLPDCKKIATSDNEVYFDHFCPTQFFVPTVLGSDKGTDYDPKGMFGFVAGCVWGDDTSWKIRYLDLSQIEEGKLTTDERFGYVELPNTTDLWDAIDMDFWDEEYQIVNISCMKRFDLNKKEEI